MTTFKELEVGTFFRLAGKQPVHEKLSNEPTGNAKTIGAVRSIEPDARVIVVG